MKNLLKSNYLPYLTVSLGGVALVLRRVLYTVAVDEKNLLAAGHPLEILLWLVTAAAAVLVIGSVWKLKGSNLYEDNFGASLPAQAGCFAAALGILLTVLFSGSRLMDSLKPAWKVLGILSAPALVAAGLCRKAGKQPFFLLHLVPCVFFAVHMLGHYQTWSNNPQLQDYVFSLLGGIALALFAYYQAAFDVGVGKRRMQLFTGLMGVFFCCVALSGSDYPLLYLGGGAWAITDLCSFKPAPEKSAPEGEQEE